MITATIAAPICGRNRRSARTPPACANVKVDPAQNTEDRTCSAVMTMIVDCMIACPGSPFKLALQCVRLIWKVKSFDLTLLQKSPSDRCGLCDAGSYSGGGGGFAGGSRRGSTVLAGVCSQGRRCYQVHGLQPVRFAFGPSGGRFRSSRIGRRDEPTSRSHGRRRCTFWATAIDRRFLRFLGPRS